MNLNLFSNTADIKTFGIKYVGSKQKLIPYILEEASKCEITNVLDVFSGTTRVSQAFALAGYSVIANDLAIWSSTFAKAFLFQRDDTEIAELIEHLNTLPPVHGWFTEHYGGELGEAKKVWQKKNTKKLDAIRAEIDKLNLSEVNKAIALTSLILALDKVDSSLGHFTSYLKDWSARSFNDLVLEIPCYQGNQLEHSVENYDVLGDEILSLRADLAYLDPPYGSNNKKMPASRVRYASYYHLWTTIIKNDQPSIFGAAGRREDSRDTVAVNLFEEFRKSKNGRFIALEAIEQVISKVNARYVMLSYSSGGRATQEELTQVLSANGKIRSVLAIDYKQHIMASMAWTNAWVKEIQKPHREFIFVLEK